MRKAGVHDSVITAQTGNKTVSMPHLYDGMDESDGLDASRDYLIRKTKKFKRGQHMAHFWIDSEAKRI